MQPTNPNWQKFAACKDKDLKVFYPTSAQRVAALPAIRICNSCAVQNICLEYAMDTKEAYGVWGGLTAHERRLLRRARARQLA
jgi:WhiB family transcriptional regulator, redox-sensing transcriptional regulator